MVKFISCYPTIHLSWCERLDYRIINNRKVGIGFILLSFVLLGTVGATRATGMTAGMTKVNYKGGYDEEGVPIKRVEGINYWEILSIGQVWLLLWGAIYLLPFAFGIPFML